MLCKCKLLQNEVFALHVYKELAVSVCTLFQNSMEVFALHVHIDCVVSCKYLHAVSKRFRSVCFYMYTKTVAVDVSPLF